MILWKEDLPPMEHGYKIDKLGRVTIPSHIRKYLHLEPDSRVDIMLEGEAVVIRKIADECIFCRRQNQVIPYRGYFICADCLAKMKLE